MQLPKEAVVLAAGMGTRLGGDRPKCLTPVAGRPLIAWVVEALAGAGVETVHIVGGYRAGDVEAAASTLELGPSLRVARCPDWELGNGRTAAFAERVVEGDAFYLLMSDHLVGREHIEVVGRAARPDGACALGICSAEPWIDLEDATKVDTKGGDLVLAIGKELTVYDGIDTGVFAMSRALFPALEEAHRAGEHSLTAGNRRLARGRKLVAARIGTLRWQDVDTPADLAAAEAWLRK